MTEKGKRDDERNQKKGIGDRYRSCFIFEVIQKAIHFSNISDGVFDISIGPVVDLWAIGTDKARVPGKDEIKGGDAFVFTAVYCIGDQYL